MPLICLDRIIYVCLMGGVVLVVIGLGYFGFVKMNLEDVPFDGLFGFWLVLIFFLGIHRKQFVRLGDRGKLVRIADSEVRKLSHAYLPKRDKVWFVLVGLFCRKLRG